MADSPTPAVRAVLAWLESSDRPALHELDPAAAREAMDALARAEPITEVGSVTDRTIPGPAGDLPVRVYAPASDGPHPVVVFFHGGGFVVGSLDGYDDPCRLLTSAAEAVVVSVDYRLAPEHPFPAAVEDAYAATEWVAAHVGDLPGDGAPDRLAVAGDSAGGTLAAVVSLAARDRDGPRVDAQALIYPSVDFRQQVTYPSRAENGEGYFLTLADVAYFAERYVPSWVHEPNPYLSPLCARSHADLPPASVVTCGFDPLRDEGEAYAEALASDGTPVAHHRFPGLIHGVINMVAPPAAVPGGRDVIEAVAGDLRERLA